MWNLYVRQDFFGHGLLTTKNGSDCITQAEDTMPKKSFVIKVLKQPCTLQRYTVLLRLALPLDTDFLLY